MICLSEEANSPLQACSIPVETLKEVNLMPEGGSKHHVRFAPCLAEVVGTVPSRWTMSKEDIRSRWCSEQDLERSRIYARYFASDVLAYDKLVVDKMDDACSTAMHMAVTVSEDDLPQQLQELSKKKTRCLNEWAAIGYSRRGLERMVSQKQKTFRGNLYQQTRDIVTNYQKLRRGPMTSTGCKDDIRKGKENATVVDAEELRKLCQDISRPSRIFARMMGQADSDAVLGYYNIKPKKREEKGRRHRDRVLLARSHSEKGSFDYGVVEKRSTDKVVAKTGAHEGVEKIVSRPSLHGSRSVSSRSLLSSSRTIFEST